MAFVTFKDKDITISVEDSVSVMECIRVAGLNIETPCNGKGKCGKCKVIAKGDLYEKTKEEERYTTETFERLACMARVKGDVEIQLIDKKNELKTVNEGYSITVDLDSEVKKVQLPDIKFESSIAYEKGIPYKINSLEVYKKIALAEKNKKDKLYGVIFQNYLIDIVKDRDSILGVAIDIGTTGISAYLIDLESGNVINKSSSLNPQTEYGGDVLSRITYCNEVEDGIDVLKKSIREKIDDLIEVLIEDKYKKEEVYILSIAANTTMMHLFTGVIPNSLSKAPYRPIFKDKLLIKASELDIHINKEGKVLLLPSLSSYVGADIVAGIIATGFYKKHNPAVFIDIGTNGELAAIYQWEITASSTAAGPAFEGMNISCGGRAEEGAIDSFSIDEDYNIVYSIIGEVQPKSICGSGLIDIAAAFVQKKIILKSGRFNKELPLEIRDRLRDKKFYITDNIYVSQEDIRQIQLAKGAISSGITMILKELGTTIDKIEEVVVAGSFGYHLNPESIRTMGIIPKDFNGNITFVGNSSIEGARLSLINKSIIEKMDTISDKVRVIELSTRDDFQNYFVKALSF